MTQMDIPFPPIPRKERDFTGEARADLTRALATAKAASLAPPWEYRKQRYWRVVFPQMANWLPDEERVPLVAEFMVELERIEALFAAEVTR